MALPRVLILLGLVLTVASCGWGNKPLTRLKNPDEGPDEFLITPGKPLQEPKSYSELPTPEPGAPNLADRDPRAEGIAALGGKPGATAAGGIPASDSGLVRYADRHGVRPDIRQVLRVEDDKIRRDYGRRNILHIGPRDNYTDAYKKQWLDAQAEEERLRRLGIRTPSAPPAGPVR